MSDDRSTRGLGTAALALKTHDLLCHIFEVDRRIANKRKLSRKDLLRCALVSRAFCEPALRALWTDMSPPTPLWRLLAHANTESTQKALTSKFFDSILSDKLYADPILWARFMWYARFVRELHITDFGMEDKHKQLIHALVAHNGGGSIFPSLRTLWWSPSSDSDSSYFPLFTPQLRSAIFHFPHSTDADAQDPQTHTFLARLRASSPQLGYLCVDACWERIGVSHLRFISSFERLTDLNLAVSISLTAFCQLATMPGMNSLRIAYVQSDEQAPSPPRTQTDAPQLTLISVGGDCPTLTHLFNTLNAPRLACASFHAMCDDRTKTLPDYVSCIKALATVCPSSDVMRDLCIALDENGGPRTLEYLTDLVDPLLGFGNLAHFSLSCPTVGLVADDCDFWAIARRWRKLQTFRLWQAFWDPCVGPGAEEDSDSESDGIPIPTPEVLEAFRKHCPHLRELVLPHLEFDADVPSRRVRSARRCHGLELLAFGEKVLGGGEDEEGRVRGRTEPDVDDGQIADWARYILDLFKKLDAQRSFAQCRSMSTETGWVKVFKRVREIQKTRVSSPSGGSLV